MPLLSCVNSVLPKAEGSCFTLVSDSLCVLAFMDHTPLFLLLHHALLSQLVFHTSIQCFPHLPSPLGFVRAEREKMRAQLPVQRLQTVLPCWVSACQCQQCRSMLPWVHHSNPAQTWVLAWESFASQGSAEGPGSISLHCPWASPWDLCDPRLSAVLGKAVCCSRSHGCSTCC